MTWFDIDLYNCVVKHVIFIWTPNVVPAYQIHRLMHNVMIEHAIILQESNAIQGLDMH